MLENDTALVVRCMPAFAAFIRMHNSGSTFFKSLRSKIFGDRSSGKNRTIEVTHHIAEPSPGHGFKSYDQTNRPVHSYYYELNDNAPMYEPTSRARRSKSN